MRVELCPQCGSGKVSRVNPLGDTCKCDGCGWAGKERELMVTQIAQGAMDVAVAVAQQFLVQLTQEASLPIGRAMFRAGLIQRDTDSAIVGRLVRAAVTAASTAVLSEVDAIQKEISDGTTGSRQS
jgi:hypothetical protein